MQITLQFNPKSTARNVKKAIKLAEKLNSCKYSGEEKVISVTQSTDSVDKDFIVILEIVFRLAKTQILIDEETIEETEYIYDLITCVKKTYCNGICSLRTSVFYELFQEIGIANDRDLHFGIYDNYIKKLNIAAPEIFTLIDAKHIEISRDKLIEAYIESCSNVYKACSAYNVEATVNEIKKQPEIISVKIGSLMNLYDEDEEDEDYGDSDTSDTGDEKDQTDNQHQRGILISPEQLNEIVIKVSDELEIRLRKLISEIKK